MQQDFETIMNEFMAKVKSHLESQNATLAEYESFFNRASELFPAYAGFVQHVIDSLTVIQEMNQNSVPVSVAEPVQKQKAKPKLQINDQEHKYVLIVDDAEINRILMGHFFKGLPVTLEFASSGEQAISKINLHRFDLIIMDLQMKGMSGVEAIQSIRQAQPENEKKTQILAITNVAPTDEERKQVIQSGANEYLSKSMPREVIKDKVLESIFGIQSISA